MSDRLVHDSRHPEEQYFVAAFAIPTMSVRPANWHEGNIHAITQQISQLFEQFHHLQQKGFGLYVFNSNKK